MMTEHDRERDEHRGTRGRPAETGVRAPDDRIVLLRLGVAAGRARRTGSGPAGHPRCPGHDERRLELGDPRVGLRELDAQVVERALSVGQLALEALAIGCGRPRGLVGLGARHRGVLALGGDLAADRPDDAAEPAARVAQLAPQRVHGAREADLEAGVADPVRDRQLQQRPAPGRERVGRRDVRRELERRRERGPQHPVPGAVRFDDRAQLEALDRVLQQQQLYACAERPRIGRTPLELDDGDVAARGRDLEADDLEGGIHAQVPRGGASSPRSSARRPSTSSVSVRSASSETAVVSSS